MAPIHSIHADIPQTKSLTSTLHNPILAILVRNPVNCPRTLDTCKHTEPCITYISPISTQKSPISTQKSPISTQKSPISTQKSPISTQKSPISTQKSPISTRMRCMHAYRALYPLKEPHIHSKEPHIQKSPVSTQKSPYALKSPLSNKSSFFLTSRDKSWVRIRDLYP